MDGEVEIELASQQIIKLLLGEPKFIVRWQTEVKRILEEKHEKYQDDEGVDLRKPSTSSSSTSSANKPPDPSIISIKSAVTELTSTIQYVIETFESNVDPRNCFLSDKSIPNRDASSLFEAGLKVEKLTNLVMIDKKERDNIGMQIGAACRRVSQVLKVFGKRFQGQPSLEIRNLLPIIHRLCRLFYTISQEISRFSDNFRSRNRKLLKSIGKSVEEVANEFNLNVLAEIERIEKHLEMEEKRKTRRKLDHGHKTLPPKPIITIPTKYPDYGGHVITTRRQQRLATSIQEVIGSQKESDDFIRNERFRRPHPPGGIAASIIPKRRGFLMDDNLMKARQRIARIAPKSRDIHVMTDLNIDKNTNISTDDTDDVIMKSARKMTELVLEDMRKSIKF